MLIFFHDELGKEPSVLSDGSNFKFIIFCIEIEVLNFKINYHIRLLPKK